MRYNAGIDVSGRAGGESQGSTSVKKGQGMVIDSHPVIIPNIELSIQNYIYKI